MASVIDICNLALIHIGEAGNVASIDPPENSTQARYCARLYPVARDEVLEAHTWRFNTRRVALASVQVPESVAGEWTCAYGLPADCLRPFQVYCPGRTEVGKTEDFTVEVSASGDQVIYTNVEGAYLKYVIRVTDAAKFPPTFVAALSARLASKLASPMTRSAGMISGMDKLARVELANAAAVDAAAQSTEDWKTEAEPFWVAGR